MKINELEIQNIRGIKELKLKPKGQNVVVWGRNGAGKSALVDAIDFLLKGEIVRLTGPGTKEVTLKKHGPHIDCKDLSKSFIRAEISVNGITNSFEISRCLEKPQNLVYQPEFEKILSPILDVAKLGQHILTRREILRFITAKGGERAEQIQYLLNLSDVEVIRKTIGKVESGTERNLKLAQRNLQEDRRLINSRVGILEYSEKDILDFINEKRNTLGGNQINSLKDIKSNITPISSPRRDQTINISLIEQDFANINKVNNEEFQNENKEIHLTLDSLVSSIHEDASALQAISSQQLVSLGITLLDGTGKCPLCDKDWDEDDLRQFLEEKLSSISVVQERIDKIESEAKKLNEKIGYLLISLDRIVQILEKDGSQFEKDVLIKWKKDLISFRAVLEKPVSKYHDLKLRNEQIQILFAPDIVKNGLSKLLDQIKEKHPEETPEQIAWDLLTELGVELDQESRRRSEVEVAELVHKRAEILKDEFEKARDDILGDLYKSIKDRFVQLYRDLHNDDESRFDASLKPSGASLDFEVDFYGRGSHPPQAMHSEGHQDSMGVCLFLALSEKLSNDLVDLIILDDVVMSVDSNHRRKLCDLLVKHFPKKQFLITTHDRVWANQLKFNGVVGENGFIEFYDWNIDTGPYINEVVDMWDRIQEDLIKDDVPAAAAKLRRGGEQFFSEVCQNLFAKVTFNLEGSNDLGELISSAMGQFNFLLKEAKKSYDSWKDEPVELDGDLKLKEDEEKELKILSETKRTIFNKIGKEMWSVNVNIHFNQWADFSVKEFEPIVKCYKDLYDLFICNKCNSIIRVIPNGKNPQNVRCNCGEVNWNLVKKK